MRVLAGAMLLLAAEQSFAHAHLIGFPNHDVAARVLVPASLVFLLMGCLLMTWGILADFRTPRIGNGSGPEKPGL